MRKITQEIGEAFKAHRPKKVGNTETDGNSIWLHGNEIVRRCDEGIEFTLAGCNTPTTKERLKSVDVYVYNHKGVPHYQDGAIEDNQWYKK